MHTYKRSARVKELIQQELSKIIQEFKKPGLGFVTITEVKLTDDLQTCRAFYSVYGSEDDIKRTIFILKEETPSIRFELGRRVAMRRVPTLTFTFDDTPQKATRIFSLLEHIKDEEPGQGGSKPSGKK